MANLDDVERAVVERAILKESQQNAGGQDELLDALKKAVRALRKQNDEQAAATVAHFAEQLHARGQQRDSAPQGSQLGRAVIENFEKADPNRRSEDLARERTTRRTDEAGRPEHDQRAASERQDRRVDELADQVARLSKMVERLANRLEQNEKQTDKQPEKLNRVSR